MNRSEIFTMMLLIFAAAPARNQSLPLLIPPANYAAEGAPFTATIEATWERPASVDDKSAQPSDEPRLTRIERDHAGRERFETLPNRNAPPARATIYDIPSARILRLDLSARTYTSAPMEHLARPIQIHPDVPSSLPPLDPSEGQTLLGLRTIAGLEAWGQHQVLTSRQPNGQSVTLDREVWTSTHYRIPLKIIRPDGSRGRLTMSVISFDPSEPDPALFQIPDGFTEVASPTPKPTPNGTYQIGNGVSVPVPITMPEPEFSEQARREKISGSVLVSLVVDAGGQATNIHVVRGLGHGLDEKAVEAVGRYRFKPAMLAGSPVPVALNVEVNFQIFGKP